jgi:hypothetical protein
MEVFSILVPPWPWSRYSPATNAVTYFLFIDTHGTDTLGWTGSLLRFQQLRFQHLICICHWTGYGECSSLRFGLNEKGLFPFILRFLFVICVVFAHARMTWHNFSLPSTCLMVLKYTTSCVNQYQITNGREP